MGKHLDKVDSLPLFQFRPEINFDSYPTFDRLIKFFVNIYPDKARLAASLDISPSNLSQRSSFDGDITFNDKHVQGILDSDPRYYDYLIGWLEHQRQKKTKTTVEKKAAMFDKLQPFISELIALAEGK